MATVVQGVVYAFRPGEEVEACDDNRKWRPAVVLKRSPCKGMPGYYIHWKDVPLRADPVTGIQPSTGGWHPEYSVRTRTA